MTINQIIKNSRLGSKEGLNLLSFIEKKPIENLLTHLEQPVGINNYRKFKILEKHRLKNWPLAYLTGQKEFFSLNFLVNKNVLVPRPETELIVEEVLREVKSQSKISRLIIDLGTGSGAIIISIAKNLKISDAKFLASDISRSALLIAKKNSKIHNLNKKIRFYQGNLLQPILKKLSNQHLIITANLPYLTKEQIKNSPTISREPKIALDGGPEGLKYYRELFKQLQNINYLSLVLMIEIDPSQAKEIKLLVKNNFLAADLEIKPDLAGQKRLVIIKKSRD